jgi:phosphomannomutase
LRSSRCVREEVERAGGTAIETRVGHAFIKASMREHGALFAGELSGHYYFRENANAEEAFLAAIRVMQIMADTGKSLSTIVAEVDRYPRTGEINFRVEDKDAAIERIRQAFSDAEIYHLDGITIRYPTWWANIRKSNTEPLLRLNLEADDTELLAEARDRVVETIGCHPEE